MSKSPFLDDAEMFSPPPVGVPLLETEVASAAKRMRAAAVRASEAVQTAAESDARAKAALEAEASAEGAARAVAAACESVAQRLAGDLGHRKVIAKLRKENEALIKAKGEVEARLTERESQHAGELGRVGREHCAALRAAAESAEAASAALRADLDEERGALFAERDAAVEKNRNYYQELMTSRESNWERLRADYESRILRLETELSTAKRNSELTAASASSAECLRAQLREQRSRYEARIADLEMRLTKAAAAASKAMPAAPTKAKTSGEAGDGKEALSMQSPSPMRPATKRKRVAFNVGNQGSPAAAAAPSVMATTMTASGPMMTSTSRTASLSDLLAFNPHSRAASNNNNNSSGGAKHKLYNPVVTPDFL